jgi:hypothetical protein
LQTIHNMETRVLTLFDDEEFFPKEEPKKKPKKEPKIDEVEHTEDSAKKIENPEPAVTENHTSDHTTFPVDLQPESVDCLGKRPCFTAFSTKGCIIKGGIMMSSISTSSSIMIS